MPSQPSTVARMAQRVAESPAVFQSFAQLNGAMGTAKLSVKIREQISLLTAHGNACIFCLSALWVLGKTAGPNQTQIDGARKLESSDPALCPAHARPGRHRHTRRDRRT